MNYLNDLEKLDYYINIETVGLTSGNNNLAAVRANVRNSEQQNASEEEAATAATVFAKLNGLTYWK